MSARSLFGVVVRTVGLWFAVRGVIGLLDAIVNAAIGGLRGGWLISAAYLLGGVCMMRGAPYLVRFAYAADDDRG